MLDLFLDPFPDHSVINEKQENQSLKEFLISKSESNLFNDGKTKDPQ
jgi:hypothetical protein